VERTSRFKWREQGDRIFGPGTNDMKGGTIVMLMVLKALKKYNPDLFNQLTFHLLFNATEETSSRDFPRLARKYADKNSLACLVYEQGRIIGRRNKTGIIVSRRGSARFRIEVTGRAAHSGAGHHMGINAVRELARIIERVESMTDYKRGLTFNAGVVQGGQVVNTVPPYAVCLVDMRTSNPADFRRGIRRILALSGPGSFKSPYDGQRAQIKVSLLPEFVPWPETPKNRKLASLILDCARKLKQPLGTYTAGASSDGNFFHDIVPTIDGLGPVGANSHCAVHAPARGRMQEHAFRSSFVRRALLSVMAVEALA
jgi:glutamate carboxypeptidase